jgi:hypothetical protein
LGRSAALGKIPLESLVERARSRQGRAAAAGQPQMLGARVGGTGNALEVPAP